MSTATRPLSPSRRPMPEAKPKKRQWWHYALYGTALVALAGLFWGGYKIWFALTHVRASYARVSGVFITFSPKDDTRVKSIEAQTGQRVRKGQVLALLDNEGAAAALAQAKGSLTEQESALNRAEADLELTIRETAANTEEAQAQLDASQARLAQAETEMKMQSRQQPDEVRRAKADLSAAQARLRQLEAGPRPQEIAQARADLKSAESRLESAISTRRRMEKLQKEGAVSAQQLDIAQTDEEVAQSAVAVAREKLNMMEAGSRAEDIEAARQAVAAADSALAVAESKILEGLMKAQQVATRAAEAHQASARVKSASSQQQTVALKEQDVLAKRAMVTQARAGVQAAEARLEETELRSTVDGIVVRGPGQSIHAGEVVTKGTPVVTVVGTDQPLWISAAISETKVRKVREGQPAIIRIEGYGRKRFRGKVVQVGGATEFSSETSPWMLQQVPVKISFETKGRMVIPGMSCRVWIDVRR